MNTLVVLCPDSGQPITYKVKRRVGGEVQVVTAECPAGNSCNRDVPLGGHREMVAAALAR